MKPLNALLRGEPDDAQLLGILNQLVTSVRTAHRIAVLDTKPSEHYRGVQDLHHLMDAKTDEACTAAVLTAMKQLKALCRSEPEGTPRHGLELSA